MSPDQKKPLDRPFYNVPSPQKPERCKGCPYPGMGFICWYADGSCLRTDMNRLDRKKKSR